MKILLYTNILTPYRRHFFDSMFNECKKRGIEFRVALMAESEDNRGWHYSDYKTEYTDLLPSKTIKIKHAYIHFNSNLKTYLNEYSPDVMICGGSYFCPGVWQVTKSVPKCMKYYWSESHLDETKQYNKLLKLIRSCIRKSFYKRYDGFMYAGELSLRFIKTYSRKGSIYIHLPNLIDESKYKHGLGRDKRDVINELHLCDDRRIVFIPARLEFEKGLDEFISLLSACKHRDSIQLVVAGEGSLKEHLIAYAEEKRVKAYFLGYKNQTEMVELYSISDYFALPSLADPNPLSCIEALWMGLPLIVSKHVGNYIETVEDGLNGCVLDYSDIPCSTEKLDNILSADSTWMLKAKQISREKAEKQYCTSNNVCRIIDELENNAKRRIG